MKPVVFGFKGELPTEEELDFFNKVNPLGFIFFARNIASKEQVKQAMDMLYEATGNTDLLFMIDQEGGRVERIKPPLTRYSLPPIQEIGNLAATDIEAAKIESYIHHQKLAVLLGDFGFNVDCAPVADLFFENASDIIGTRSFSHNPDIVIECAEEAIMAFEHEGIIPIIKHIPGHGRANVDSHLDLPVVDTDLDVLLETDFKVFKALSHAPIAMTAHIIYTKLDPENPFTLSKKGVSYIKELLGTNQLFITDDLSMHALSGSFTSRAEKALEAGCDILLHCNGNMEEMVEIAEVAMKAADMDLAWL